MASKNMILILLFAAALVAPSLAVNWDSFIVKYGSPLDPLRLNSFYTQPRTVKEAQDKGWIQPPETLNEVNIQTFCEENDPRICILFDAKGSIAGYQIAIPTEVDTQSQGIDYTTAGFDRATLFGKNMYATRSFFVPQDVIAAGGRDWDSQTGTGLWLKIGDSLQEVPLNECDIFKVAPLFKKQNCFSKMGQHYFYNVSRDQGLEGFSPFFVLYSETGELHGYGLVVFGSKVENKSFISRLPGVGRSEWFETLPKFAVRKIAPDSPDWMGDYVSEYGPYSHHVYFTSKPWNHSCDRTVNCEA